MSRRNKGWKNESHRHQLAGMGISTSNGIKAIKPSDKIDINKYFDYNKAGYDIDSLLLIPSRKQSKKHLMWDVEDYIYWLRGESSYGEDVKIKIFLKDEAFDKPYDLEDFDIEKNRLVRYEGQYYNIPIKRPLNRNNIENIIKIDSYGTYDFYGELIYDYEVIDMLDNKDLKLKEDIFDLYNNQTALRLKNMDWIDITPESIKKWRNQDE